MSDSDSDNIAYVWNEYIYLDKTDHIEDIIQFVVRVL